MSFWKVRYVHKISPSPKDTGPIVSIPDESFADRNKLGSALRKAKVLARGARVNHFRVEGDTRAFPGTFSQVTVFPSMPGMTTYWHAIVLTHV
jgi:hypothetical protein